MGEQLYMEIMVPQRAKEANKTSEVLPVSLPVTIPEIQNNTEDRGSMDVTVELKNNVIHQQQTPGQHWGAVNPSPEITEEGMTLDTEWEEK